ncbi:unnamed protein product [Cyclocybe aegerita]|uniref:G domain-containing protein n=1 Tax=Cyclocybe aegerita TaxID=1973307 RepID=A0A8S0WAN8_CYCAE|nr:unnamed protein product [Cyclocybe aegerita]
MRDLSKYRPYNCNLAPDNLNLAGIAAKIKEQNKDTMKPSEIVILVTGEVGAGKSTFINRLLDPNSPQMPVGHGQAACTTELNSVRINRNGVCWIVVDTPSFNQADKCDQEILLQISTWLKDNFGDTINHGGIAYLQDVSSNRPQILDLISFLGRKHFSKKVQPIYARILLATTKWNKDPDACSHQQELESMHWKNLIEGGSKVLDRGVDVHDPWEILEDFLNHIDNSAKPQTASQARTQSSQKAAEASKELRHKRHKRPTVWRRVRNIFCHQPA